MTHACFHQHSGIGLDDSFIIMGAFERTNVEEETLIRIQRAIEDVGLSITLTTVTSALAFSLGIFSSVPSVAWVCYYAAPTICIIFVYQLSFFIACIVLDEQRKQQKRYDCCCCYRANDTKRESDDNLTVKTNSPVGKLICSQHVTSDTTVNIFSGTNHGVVR